MIDSNQIIYDFLTASGSDLYDLIGNRCWSPVINQGFENTSPALVFRCFDSPDYNAELYTVRVEFQCLGGSESYSDAREVYRALKTKLHSANSETVDSGRIDYAKQMTSTQEFLDMDTGWPKVLADFEILMTP